MNSVKKGDFVVNFSETEMTILVGIVEGEPNDTDEHDLKMFDGSIVSPVTTSESFTVPENFAKWFDVFLNKYLPVED